MNRKDFLNELFFFFSNKEMLTIKIFNGNWDEFAPYQFVGWFIFTLYNHGCGGLVFNSGEGALKTATGTTVYSRHETYPMEIFFWGSDKK